MASSSPLTRSLSPTDLIRIRANANEDKSTVIEWQGQVLSYSPGERPKIIFKVKGMSVTRVKKLENGSYDLLTREVQLYLDPSTEEVLSVWHNPWSDKDVNVVHVANNPVYQNFPNSSSYEARLHPGSGNYSFQIAIPLAYPNPLNSLTDPGDRTEFVGSQSLYSAIESFTFTCSAAELDSEEPSISSMEVYWARTSPLLPFMATPDTGATLMTIANGAKVKGGWEALSPVLRDVIETKLPAYKDAPTARDRPGGGVSSWSYFARPDVLKAYKEGVVFPLHDPPVPS